MLKAFKVYKAYYLDKFLERFLSSFQVMNQVFKPEVGLKHGTIFPELVSPYCPNQSIEEIEYIRATNKIGKGCNE